MSYTNSSWFCVSPLYILSKTSRYLTHKYSLSLFYILTISCVNPSYSLNINTRDLVLPPLQRAIERLKAFHFLSNLSLSLKSTSDHGAIPPASTTTRLVLLSLLDGALPLLYSVVTPHAVEGLCVEAQSGRIFASRSSCPSSFDHASKTMTAMAAAATDKGGVAYPWAIMGDFFSRGADSGRAATASASPATVAVSVSAAASSSGSGSGCSEGIALFKGGVAVGGVSVLALASGSFLDRGHSRCGHALTRLIAV